MSAVMAPWMSVSQTTGIPISLRMALAAQGIMPSSSCRAFQHWMAPALQPYFSTKRFMAMARPATAGTLSSGMQISKLSAMWASMAAMACSSAWASRTAWTSSVMGMGES